MMKSAFFLLIVLGVVMNSEAAVKRELFGKTRDGAPVEIYTLTDGTIEARITNYGGIIVSLKTPDRTGKVADVVLGYPTFEGYRDGNKGYFGAIIGRYANRIAHGTFGLEGKQYSVPKNDGSNSLHGGLRGFDKVVWQAKPVTNGVELKYVSQDGDQGYPGTLTAFVRYTLHKNELRIEYSATTDRPTVLNLTNHSYFNLAGQDHGDILQHQLTINAGRFTPVDATLIPTGELAAVEGTPFDFRQPHAIGERIDSDDEQLRRGRGYDHNWVLDSGGGKLALAATVYEPSSGRVLEVLTAEPGIQFYSGNFLDGTITGKDNKVYGHRAALCLETQHFPDSPNHATFPSTELTPGQRYRTMTVFRFSTR